jgi:hypothetical protein
MGVGPRKWLGCIRVFDRINNLSYLILKEVNLWCGRCPHPPQNPPIDAPILDELNLTKKKGRGRGSGCVEEGV